MANTEGESMGVSLEDSVGGRWALTLFMEMFLETRVG